MVDFQEQLQQIVYALNGITSAVGPTGATGATGATGTPGTAIPVIGKVDVSGTLQPGSTGITSVTHIGTGVYTIVFSTPFANTNYKPFLTGDEVQSQNLHYSIIDTSSMQMIAVNDSAFTIVVFQ